MHERDRDGMFVATQYQFEKLTNENPTVKEWLKDRPRGTKVQYGSRLHNFCKDNNITPEQFQNLKPFEARDLVWNYVTKFKGEKPREAAVTMAALKSFYRNKDGVQLPFDSRRGGKHYIRAVKKKAKYEIVPDKEQTYRLVDATSNLRDRALFLTLFESGVRVNAAISLNVGHVRPYLFPEPTVPLVLKVTDDLDTKLKGAAIPFYITGLQAEAVEALRNYVRATHMKSSEDTPLFITRRGARLTQQQILATVKKACRKAGLDEKGIWTHSLRKAFRKVVRRTSIDDEHKEQVMGHVLEGSREAYFDRHATEEIMTEYMKCDFSRELPQNNHTKMKREIEDLQNKVQVLEAQRQALVTPQFEQALTELPKEQLLQLAANFQKMIERALKEK